MKQRGFTVLEVIVLAVFLLLVGGLLLMQTNTALTEKRDAQRKTAINAMHYSLKNGYHKEHGHYPVQISNDILPTMDAELFKDPRGIRLGQTTQTVEDTEFAVQSDYSYKATGCKNNQCTGYILRATLEREAEYVKTNED